MNLKNVLLRTTALSLLVLGSISYGGVVLAGNGMSCCGEAVPKDENGYLIFDSVEDARNFLISKQQSYLDWHDDSWMENAPKYKIRIEGDIPNESFKGVKNLEAVFLTDAEHIGDKAFEDAENLRKQLILSVVATDGDDYEMNLNNLFRLFL